MLQLTHVMRSKNWDGIDAQFNGWRRIFGANEYEFERKHRSIVGIWIDANAISFIKLFGFISVLFNS